MGNFFSTAGIRNVKKIVLRAICVMFFYKSRTSGYILWSHWVNLSQ